MTSRIETSPVLDEVIAALRQRFAEQCKQLLERQSAHAHCSCGRGAGSSEEHPPDCPVAAFREAAHCVWLWGQG